MASDARLDWLEDWLTLKLNLKGDRLQVAFKKLLAGDDGSAARNFVEQAECGRVFFWMKEKELVCADARGLNHRKTDVCAQPDGHHPTTHRL